MAYGMIVMWISVIPQLAIISGIWGLVLMFVILTTIHKLTAGGAIGTLLVSIIAMLIISALLTWVTASLFGSSIGLGGIGGTFSGSGIMNTGQKEFKFDVKTEEGASSVELSEGSIKITGEDGKIFEITRPTE